MSPRRAACEFFFLASFFRFFSRHNYHVRRRDVPWLFSGRRLFGLARRWHLTACVVVIVNCSVLTHSWIPSLCGSSCLVFVFSVDRALTESGNCSDVWNVRYSSAHYTIESRRRTRISIRLISFSCTVVLSHVSICVKHFFHWAPLRALRSRMSTCWWYRSLEPLFCWARYSLVLFLFVLTIIFEVHN